LGRGPRSPRPYGINQLADDVRELGIGRFVLVGHSMGGKVVQLAASRKPDWLTDSLAGNRDALLAWPPHGMTQNITDACPSGRGVLEWSAHHTA
jgi:pimeloyl-ACP methyl ester carboxylesterase